MSFRFNVASCNLLQYYISLIGVCKAYVAVGGGGDDDNDDIIYIRFSTELNI